MKERILVVDDETQIVRAMERFLTDAGYEVATADRFEKAVARLEEGVFEAALIDLKLADKSGIDLIRKIKKIQPETVCVVITGYGTIDSAVDAVKAGAYHYLTKPFRLENLETLLRKAMSVNRLNG